MKRSILPSLAMLVSLLVSVLGAALPPVESATLAGAETKAPGDQSSITLDGVRDLDYVRIANDPAGDLGDPGGWTGTQWTDLTGLYVAADSTTLYVYADLPNYSQAGSSGQIGLVMDVDGQMLSGGSADPWGNAISFDYRQVDGAAVPNQALPDYLVRGNIVGMEGGDDGWTELRYWNGSEWTGGGANWGGISGGQIGIHLAYSDTQGIEFAIPLADIGNPAPAEVHLQLFATQGGSGKGAYDTVPSDNQSADWSDATTQHNLVSVPLALDPAGDLNMSWDGIDWTDMTQLHVWADYENLHLFLPMNTYSTTLSQGQFGLLLDTKPGGGSGDPWSNAITLAYTTTWQNLGYTPVLTSTTLLPDYFIRGNIFGPADNGWTELRSWNGASWDGGGVDWGGIGNSGQPSLPGSRVAWSDGEGLRLTLPLSHIGVSGGDTVNLQFFGTQGGGGKGAYDTVPSDDQSTGWDDPTTQKVFASYTVPDVVRPSASHDNAVWWDGLEHDSRNDFYRQPYGAVPTTTLVTLRFRTYENDVTGVKVRVWDAAQGAQTLYPMTYLTTIPGEAFEYDIWELQFDAPDYLAVLYYRFMVTDGTDTDYYEDDELLNGGLGQAYDNSPDNSWQIDVYDPTLDTPDWFKDAVVYQIFPERFRNGLEANDPISGTFFYDEDPGMLSAPQWNWIVPDPRVEGPWEGSYSKLFYGGDLQGIIDELDYMQEMGINTLYLNPIFESPSNHKYDTTNYLQIDDNFGDLATFITLTTELESRGMHLILDGVFNHTSSDSAYFDRYGRYGGDPGACEDVNSPFRSWYHFYPADPPGTGVCAGDTTYEAWWGFDTLPKLNTTDNPEVRSYIYSDTVAVATYWLGQGADGWRLDVAGDVDHSFWQDWRAYIRGAKAEAITIAEEWGDASHFILGDELDSSMNYRFRNALIGLLRETDWTDTNSTIQALTVSEFDSLMHSMHEDYPLEAFYAMMNLVGSHDVNRVLIPLDQDGDPTDADYSDGKARLNLLFIIQLTMPGAPTTYYGDEVGLVGYGEETGGGVFYSDPYNRQPYPWPDKVGYGSLPEWRQQDLSLREHFSATAAIRNAHPALRTGSLDTLLTDDELGTYAYGRKLGSDAAVIVANLGTTQTVTVDVSGYLPEGTALTDELNGGAYTVSSGELVIAGLPPMWGAILTVDSGEDIVPPDAPPNLAAAEGNGQVELTWDAVAGAAEYNLYRSYVSSGGYELLAEGETGTIYTDTAVSNGTWYYYAVAALDALGNESGRSNEAGALPHYTIGWANLQGPSEITYTIGLTPTEDIYGQVWIGGATNQMGATDGLMAQVGFGLTGTLPVSWTMWVDAEFDSDQGNNDQFIGQLIPEQVGEYHYIYRYSTTGGRDWIYADLGGIFTGGALNPGLLHVESSGDTAAPATPQNLQVVDWAPDWIALTWDPVLGDASLYAYDLFRSEISGTVGSHLARVLTPTVAYTDTEVSTGHTYYYVLQAVDDSFNRSGYSNQAEGTAAAKEVAITFQVTVPDYTPADATIYIVGDLPELCGWCNPQQVALQKTGDVTWTRVITLPDGQPFQYKYSRGNWDVVEWWGEIVSVANRQGTADYGTDGTQLIADTVHYWRDPLVISHGPAADSTGVDPAVVITTTLSRFLDPASLTAENLLVTSGVSTPTLDIDYYHHGVMTATTIILTPQTELGTGTVYTVTLGTGIQGMQSDNEGVTLQRPYVWSFQTELVKIYMPLVFKN